MSAKTPAVHTINIALTSDGIDIPAQVKVGQGDEVEWTCDYDFALDVGRSDELFGQTLPPAALRGRKNVPVRQRTNKKAPEDTYHYAVAVWDGEKVRVLDPEILIAPGTH